MYEKLIKKLRYCGNAVSCNHCPYWEGCAGPKEDLSEAANIIEELSSLVDHYGGETGIKNLEWYASKYWDLLKNIHNWIPVARTLPKKENRTYWICTDTGYQCECRWTNNRFGIGESDEWGWSIFLPEPLEEET